MAKLESSAHAAPSRRRVAPIKIERASGRKPVLAPYMQSYRLDNVAKRGSGHTPSQAFPEYWNGGIRWLSLADSARLDQGYIAETKKSISALGIKHSSAVIHPKATVVLSRDAGVGKSAILGQDMAVSQHFIAWECNEAVIHNRYLYQWLQWKKHEFERIASGSTVQTIGLPYFKKLSICLPTLAIQHRISDWLFLCDGAIEKTIALLSVVEHRKQGLLRQLLTGRTRLKGFKGKWKTVKLDSVLQRVTRKNTSGCTVALTVSAQRGLVEQGTYFAKQIAAEENGHYVLLHKGEFAYNRSAANGYPFGAIKRLDAHKKGIVSTLCLCFAVRDSNVLDSDFFVWMIEAGQLNRAIRRIAHEGARSHGLLNVTATDFFDIRIQLPHISEQRVFASLFNDSQREIEILRGQLEAFQAQKRALMQKLLSGQWRLPERAALTVVPT